MGWLIVAGCLVLSVAGSSVRHVGAPGQGANGGIRARHRLDDVAWGWLGALWGKSAKRACGTVNLLLSHLLDTAAVAELIWDHYLADSVRRMLDEVTGDDGRRFFVWLCGVHDCGKATPAFQHVDGPSAAAVRRAGLGWDPHRLRQRRWRHDRAGAALLMEALEKAGWPAEHIGWVWPLVAGHHGVFPPRHQTREPKTSGRGHHRGVGPEWRAAQDALINVYTREVGFDGLGDIRLMRVPTRAEQLLVSGLIVMADWIASDQRHFGGVDDLGKVGLPQARVRAVDAWRELGLRGGWGRLPRPGSGTFEERFGEKPRASQVLVQDVVGAMGAPGLVIVEAPMGEGKTKAALVAAEIIAARFGQDGVFVGMPTQATSDPIFTKVREWLNGIDPELAAQVALLHGKRRFNKEWQSLLAGGGDEPDEHFGTVAEDEEDEYGMAPPWAGEDQKAERRAPAEWFLGRLRGLLSPFVVGTIDQLLFAATRTKHVMLRTAGLAGKVVILDEVHAADVYMSEFLKEGLRWLGQAGVPVVLLSATLPPQQRRDLVSAYLAGAASQEECDVSDLPEPQGYPNVTAGWLQDGRRRYAVKHTTTWREQLNVRVEVLSETPRAGQPADAVGELLEERLAEGGCALVIRNTVDRAQTTYESLREKFGTDVRLLHGRLDTGARADRTNEALSLLGPPSEDRSRPSRLILVASPLAEQSFDVDADLLISDLTTIDLLLQRIGRLHRHEGTFRPERVRDPEVFVTGFGPRSAEPPALLGSGESIYGRYLLLRTAALVLEAQGKTWSIPGRVPALVADVYDGHPIVPTPWQAAEDKAAAEWQAKQRERCDRAAPYLLTGFGEGTKTTLEGLHYGGVRGADTEERVKALVRDGVPSVEVVLVLRDERGYRTLSGRRLGPNGEASVDLLDGVLSATVRLPAALTQAAEAKLEPLPGWRGHAWLRYSRALVLDVDRTAVLGGRQVRYDKDLGLVVGDRKTRERRARR